jgi:hypothetical protein
VLYSLPVALLEPKMSTRLGHRHNKGSAGKEMIRRPILDATACEPVR